MYRNNKANLWLRTICVTVALLGMLFFTHSQFSSATAPLIVAVTIQVAGVDSSPLDATEGFGFTVQITLPDGDTIASADAVTLTYAIGTATGKTAVLTTTNTGPFYLYSTEIINVTEGDNGAITFTKVNFKTSSEPATDYTTATTGTMVTTQGTIIADTIEDITDVTSVAVGITSSGTGTDVLLGESVNVEVTVVNSAEGVAVVADDAVTGTATDHTLQYKIGAGASKDLALVRGTSDTHFTGMLTVIDSTDAGAFTFESVKLSLQNGHGDAVPAEVKTYTTPVVSLTDPGLTIDPRHTVTDVTSVAVSITGSGDGTVVTLSDTVNVDVIVVNAPQGVAIVADDTHTLQYDIGGSGTSKDLDLDQGDNATHFTGTLVVDAMTPAGVFTFESVMLSLQNAAGNAITPKETTYTTEATSDVVVSLTDAVLTLDPTSGIFVLADASAVNNTAGVGDKVTFTAWITNGTNDKPLNVTVNYKITGTKDVTGSVILTNQGPNGTNSTVDLWSGTLTIPDNATAGNLTIESIVIWIMNMDPSPTSRTITAAGANATNVVKIDIPAPVDPPAANKTTSTTSATTTASASASATPSSESMASLPVSIFAVFILIASVSMAVGVYTLRRRQQ